MGPRPYSENSSLPTDSSNENLMTVPTQILAETPTPPTASSVTTPSPTLQEIIPVEQHVDAVIIDDNDKMDGLTPCYPTPGDIMPYDHSLPDFIRQITNQTNLTNLQSLSLRVISTCISLHRMAAYLPNLRELDLEGSILNSLRDIGCSFKNLQILRVGRCQLESLDGTFGLSGLRELYAQKNLINDVSPCSNLPHIKHIDVSGNRIRNISYAGFLSVCNKLKSIIFTGNPATEVPDYRKHVRRILPQIEELDGMPFSEDDNVDEAKEPEMNKCLDNESDCSAEYPDFFSVSPSDSLNNLLDSEEDVNLLEKKNKQAKNAANQDHFDSYDYEIQNVLSTSASQDNYKNLTLQRTKNTEGILDRPKAIKFTDTKNINIKQKCTSIQKLDKDIENRSKKSSLMMKGGDEFVFLPEIVSPTSNASPKKRGNTTNLTSDMIKPFSKNEIGAEEHFENVQRKLEFQHLPLGATNIQNFEVEDLKTGTIKKRLSPLPDQMKQTGLGDFDNPEKSNLIPGVSTLTSGLPISGNLTAALRHRSRIQESKGNFKAKAQYFQSD
ncbi:hypothetical protein RUM44_007879 [Polyplax serrata]|uniref:Leucine-rich repeat-containing protein 56 n=1 Tax=Polyplax serrata TaxID=468196 RepID=A0ABR1BAQ7_POLSC